MSLPELDEALRYSGVPVADGAMRERMGRLLLKVRDRLQPRSVWRLFSLEHREEGILLKGPDVLLTGHSARRMLSGCDAAALMACTVGVAFDRLLLETQHRDMAEALLLDGLGSAWVEALCDDVQREIAAALPGRFLTDRFSPGYGDLPLALQPELLRAVNAQRRVGVTLTDSCLMNPVKSVTALVGLSDSPQPARLRGCAYCALSGSCALRKRGVSCASEA